MGLRQFFQTKDVNIEPDERAPVPLNKGPRVGASKDTLGEIARLATPEEAAAIVADLKAKRAAVPVPIWLKCDQPGCANVGPFGARAEGRACPSCNHMSNKSGGHMRAMTPAEIAAYQQTKAAQAAATAQKMRDGSFAARNLDRAKNGLPPMSRPEWDEEQARWAETRREQTAELGRISALYREKLVGAPEE